MMLSNDFFKNSTPSIFALPHSKMTKTPNFHASYLHLYPHDRPLVLDIAFSCCPASTYIKISTSGWLHHVHSRLVACRRYQNLSTTIMVFVCLYGFHKCISRLVCYWQCRSALRSAIAGTCYYRAGIARTIALYRDSWVVASVGQFNRYYCEHALSTHVVIQRGVGMWLALCLKPPMPAGAGVRSPVSNTQGHAQTILLIA